MSEYIEDINIEPKSTWSLVVHPKASCYFSNKDDLIAYLGNVPQLDLFYFIYHSKLEPSKDLSYLNHIHLVLCFKQKMTLTKIKNLFPGSHIEETGNKQASIQYLVHRTLQAKKDNKPLYNYCDIISNDKKALEKFIDLDRKNEIDSKNEYFDLNTGVVFEKLTDSVLLTCYNDSFESLVKRFGSKQITPKISIIKALRQDYNSTIDKTIRDNCLELSSESVKNEVISQYEAKMKKLDKLLKYFEQQFDKELPF